MKKYLLSATVLSIAFVSCKKEEKSETAEVTETKDAVVAAPEVDSANVAQYNKDEAEMSSKPSVLNLAGANGEKMKIEYSTDEDDNRSAKVSVNGGETMEMKLIEGHDGKDAYGDDKGNVIQVSGGGGEVVYTPKGGKPVTFK